MINTTLSFENASFTRVLWADAPIPGELVGLDAAQISAVPWANESLASGDQVTVGVAAWVADIGGRRIVFDPLQAADAFLRGDPDTEAAVQADMDAKFAAAGFPVESIDAVLLTHIDGIGMVARRSADAWGPFFPNARILMSGAELEAYRSALAAGEGLDEPGTAMLVEAYNALLAADLIDTFADGAELATGLTARHTGGHGPGHVVFDYTENGQCLATFLGHLAVSPLHLATGPCEPLNVDPAHAWKALSAIADEGNLLIGPLWPSPGCGRFGEAGFEAAAAA